MTLNQTLTSLGYTTSPAGGYRKHIHSGGAVVFIGTADDVWKWLARL